MGANWDLLVGDCRERLKELPNDIIDAVVTDPPYELGFMGKKWDGTGIANSVEFWREVLRVLKPGGHLLAFGGTRTYHRMTCAVEDAGFEMRDCLMWLYSTGFPKGARVDNEVFKRVKRCLLNAGAKYVEQVSKPVRPTCDVAGADFVLAAARIQPEGSPALLIQTGKADGSSVLTAMCLSMSEAESVASSTTLSWNRQSVDDLNEVSTSTIETVSKTTIGLQILSCLRSLSTRENIIQDAILPDGSRWPACDAVNSSSEDAAKSSSIPVLTALGSATWNPLVRMAGFNLALKPAYEPIILARKPLGGTVAECVLEHGCGGLNIDGCRIGNEQTGWGGGSALFEGGLSRSGGDARPVAGRWPANVLLDEHAAAQLDAQSGWSKSPAKVTRGANRSGVAGLAQLKRQEDVPCYDDDDGGASRFFYVAKASRSEREAGCGHLPARTGAEAVEREEGSAGVNNPRAGAGRTAKEIHNHHPTVKPIELMRYLVRLVTPPGGVVLDPFCGSGSTGCSAVLEGHDFVGCEMTAEYVPIINARIEHWSKKAV